MESSLTNALNTCWNLLDARRKIRAWKEEYNERGPHLALGLTGRRAGVCTRHWRRGRFAF